MKTRLISGTIYIAILVAFYLLKILIPTYGEFCFDVLIYAFALIGTFEMLRAMKDRTTKAQRVIVYAFAALAIPACAVSEYFFRYGLHVTSILFFAMAVALIVLLVVRHDETTPENLGVSFLSAVYPVLLLCLLVLTNHVSDESAMAKYSPTLLNVAFNSDLMILFVFVVSPFADSFAYLFGRFLRKFFPQKLAPRLSPNKTIIGAIGGLIGGLIGSTIIYFAYNAIVVGSFIDMHIWLPVYLAVGFLAAAATEFGDLVESCIKRKAEIKDMGKIMPGHGGVLDRIDGTLFACMAVYLAFSFIQLIA